jgi:phospholipase C
MARATFCCRPEFAKQSSTRRSSSGPGYVYGFRVPLIVVSPYAKAAYISHDTRDFGSILKYIEENFVVSSLGYSDAYADDLSDCFDYNQTPLTLQTITAPLDAEHFLKDKPHPQMRTTIEVALRQFYP